MTKPIKSNRLMGFDEFVLTKNVRKEYSEGFRIFLKGKKMNYSQEQWEILYSEFQNRTLE